MKISKARKAVFSLFGVGFTATCNMSPALKIHIYRTLISPIIRSGMCSMTLRKGEIETISVFERKILKSFLKVPENSPNPMCHFLFGEVSIEAKIHSHVFSLFHCIWENPNIKN